MAQPLVIGYHLIWTSYGWWLPNDPRGSTSHEIRSEFLDGLGDVHHGRKLIQPPRQEVREFYERAAALLKFPLLTLDEPARQTVADAFAEVIAAERYTCYACAVMPDHVHILIRKHKHDAEEMIARLQEASRARLLAANHRPEDHPTWTEGGWKGFIDHPDRLRRTIRYIERNPAEAGLALQRWPFVKEYDGWPLHPGHDPNSPYARRLREAGRYPG